MTANFKIIDLNDSFDKQVMSRKVSVGLSFSLDMLNYDERDIFLSAVEIMKANRNKSIHLPNMKTLTLHKQIRCKSSFLELRWQRMT